MKALVLSPKDQSAAVRDVPTPSPGPNQVLVHVRAVALNQIDPLYVLYPIATQDSRVVGSDFAGEVTQVGEDLAGLDDARVKIGARVAGFLQGACSENDRPGAFAEYVAIDFDLTWNVPASLTFEEAASVNLCGLTAAQGVFERLQLPCPFYETEGFHGLQLDESEPVNVLIYGATTSVGLYAAQLIKLAERTAGRKIRLIGAAGVSKHAMLRAEPYNYDVLVDYRDASWPEQVRQATGKSLGVQYAIDAVSQGPTVGQVESTFASQGRFAAYRSPEVGGFDISNLKIKPIIGAVWEGLGADIIYHGMAMPANQKARQFSAAFYKFLGSEAARGKVQLQPNSVRRMPGGLKSIVPEGFTLLGPHKRQASESHDGLKDHLRPVSAEKIVYII